MILDKLSGPKRDAFLIVFWLVWGIIMYFLGVRAEKRRRK